MLSGAIGPVKPSEGQDDCSDRGLDTGWPQEDSVLLLLCLLCFSQPSLAIPPSRDPLPSLPSLLSSARSLTPSFLSPLSVFFLLPLSLSPFSSSRLLKSSPSPQQHSALWDARLTPTSASILMAPVLPMKENRPEPLSPAHYSLPL